VSAGYLGSGGAPIVYKSISTVGRQQNPESYGSSHFEEYGTSSFVYVFEQIDQICFRASVQPFLFFPVGFLGISVVLSWLFGYRFGRVLRSLLVPMVWVFLLFFTGLRLYHLRSFSPESIPTFFQIALLSPGAPISLYWTSLIAERLRRFCAAHNYACSPFIGIACASGTFLVVALVLDFWFFPAYSPRLAWLYEAGLAYLP